LKHKQKTLLWSFTWFSKAGFAHLKKGSTNKNPYSTDAWARWGSLDFIMWYFVGGCKRTGINPIVSRWVRWMKFKR